MKLLFTLLCIVLGPAILFFATDPDFNYQRDFTDKSYYMNRMYSLVLNQNDEKLLKKLLIEKYISLEGSEETNVQDISVKIDNYASDIEKTYVAGLLRKTKTSPEVFRWYAIKTDRWEIVHLDTEEPLCEDIDKYRFPSLFTDCKNHP